MKILIGMLLAVAGTMVFSADVIERSFEMSPGYTLDLTNVSGNIDVRPGSGDTVRIRAKREDERIDVTFRQDGNRLVVRTEYPETRSTRGGVAFEVEVPARGDLNLNSVSGSISVSGISGTHDIAGVSGRITLTNMDGSLNVESVSGSLKLTDIGTAELDATTISGSINYEGALSGGPYRFSSTSGSVSIRHGADASYSVEGSTVSGSISADAPGVSVNKQKYGPMKDLTGQYNGNGTTLRVNTVSGSISISVK
ncbi:MAG: DUF4097 family beta strand repeat protein [Acidobacteria bacterium]|nr:DUF4097 family beta strand repeat protein [Acidobacteriota bacterium]